MLLILVCRYRRLTIRKHEVLLQIQNFFVLQLSKICTALNILPCLNDVYGLGNLVPGDILKACEGLELMLHSVLNLVILEVSGQLYTPDALLLGKQPPRIP